MAVADPLLRALADLGFNLNEGRAYSALLQRGPSTGYEVSRDAGVPRSAVYAVLRQLVEQGFARREPGPPERFTATPPRALERLLRQRFEGSTTALRTAAARLPEAPTGADAFEVSGYERILEQAQRLVLGARKRLVLGAWPRELAALASALAKADRRGVFVVVFSHATPPAGLAGVQFSYGLAEADLEAFWAHRLVLVADDRTSLLGATEGKTDDRAVVSETPAIAEIAVSQVALDITLLAQRHGVDVTKIMARMLGDRVGRLDRLLVARPEPRLGVASVARRGSAGRVASKTAATSRRRRA